MTGEVSEKTDIPAHIPKELLVDYDPSHGPEVMKFPPAAVNEVQKRHRVAYSTRYDGFWVFTRYNDIRAAYQNAELFEQHMGGLHRAPFNRIYLPLSLNPPEHVKYRRPLTPIFGPKQIRALEPLIREVARERLSEIAKLGKVNFASEFALGVSSAMFCGMIGRPVSDFPILDRMSTELVYDVLATYRKDGPEAAQAQRARVAKEIEDFMAELIPERRKNPGDDAISMLLEAEVDGRKLTEDEILNMSSLLFFAGTDSTAAAVTYAHIFLAENIGHRQQIIDNLGDDSFIWNAAEELMRYNGFHQLTRRVTRDAEFAGVDLKEGDLVLLPCNAANHDEAQYEASWTVDFGRHNAKTHLTFGAGPHRCMGSHLATTQLRIALQEVHKAIPDYKLAEPVTYISGSGKVVPERVIFTFLPHSNA